MKSVLTLALGVAVSAAVSAGPVTDEVNCFLGTEGTGHTFPAAAYPFGLVQAGPDTGWGTWEYCSGYQYRDKRITMFSQTHNSGGGCSDYADIGIMPVTGKVSVPVQIAATEKGKASTTSVAREYDKASERAEPGYYAVTLADGIRVEAAASELCAVYRITYPQGVTPRLLVDLDYGMEGNPLIGYGARKRTATKESAWRNGELLAHIVKNGFVPDRQIGVAMRFEPKPSAVEELPRQEGKHAPQYVADFNLAADRTLLVRIGLSTASAAGAARNLERQVGTVGFDDVRRAASEKWETVLSRIRLEGGDRETRVNFATAVYRMFLQPQNVADDDAAEPYYSEFSLWDTFRGAHPIYTLAAKEYVPKFVNSLLAHQERFGYLPVLPKWGRDTQCMIGTHAVSVIAEAYFKGFKGVDWERAYRAVKNTLTEPHKGRIKENWDLYDRHGYYPFDRIHGESVSRTLECSYDDWCAMKLAEALGHAEDAAFFRRRASCWTNVFDRSIGFVRGRDSQGRWREPFDPYQLGHGADTANDFTEGNAFQYTWHVLQDPQGLMDVLGGRQAFVRKLDELFAAKDKVEGAGCVVDVTGLIGQYAHGNEPSHHIAYLYQYAGRGDRTAEKVREICRKFYRNAPDGLCGNEDHGEMSAWYVFACMGFYPVSPASGEYVLGAPQVPSVSVDVGGGKVFRVVAKGLSEQAKYVKSVSLNGRPLDGFILRHADIENGGELVFEMTDRPSVPSVPASAGPSFSLRWNRRFRFDAERPLPRGMTFLPAMHCSARVESLPGEMRFVRGDETLASFAAPTNVAPPYEMHVMLTGAHTPAVFVTKDGATTLAGLPKWPEGFDPRVATLTNAVRCVVSGNLGEPKMSLSAGIGQADTRFVTTGRCNRPYRKDGRLFFTFSARGYGAYLGVMSFDPDKLDFRLEGVVLFDYGDGLLRNDVAADLFYDDVADEWRAYVSNFSTGADSLGGRAKGGLNCAWSKECPLFGVSVMKAKSLDFDGMNEDPDGYWDERAKKWRLLVSEFVRGIGIRASLWESDRWDGPFVRLSGPVAEDSTGTTLASVGGGLVALAGSSDRRFHLYDYPALRRKGCLEVANPPWEASSSGNGRSWPAYVELPDGRALLLTFDRVNFPGMPKPNWTYGGLFLYEGRTCPSAIPTFDLSGGRQHMFQVKGGRIPVSVGRDGQLVVEAWMCDEKQGLGDRLVLLADGKEFASGRVIKRTKTVSDYRIEATVPRTDAVLEIRVEDDDGKGVDGWATTGEFRVRGLPPIRFATPFGDGMVLQRDRRVPVWGTADAGAKVEVSFAGQVKTAVADQSGRWRVDLDPMPACKTGRPLTVQSINPPIPQSPNQTISNVLVGEVWIVSGQSNCELPLVGKHPHFGDREGIMTANMTHRPFIRFAYASTYRYSLEPRTELRERAVWKEFNPKNLRESPGFSAMGVYFALAVESEIQVPVGLIGVYWGGTRIEPWIPIEALEGVKGSEWCLAEKPVVDSQWRKEMFGGRLEWPNSQPAVLWNDMIAPWCPMAARGVLWYQGCSNARAGQFEMNDNYRLLMHALYDSWSKRFGQPDLKLYFVQLAPWPWNHWDVQLAQAKFAEEERNAAMVTTCDIGNLSDIHPNEKGTVGRRLALLALRHDYGFTDLIADAPVLETCVADGDRVKMTFRDASAFWLYHRDWSVDVPFELAGADGRWTKAHLVNTVNGCTNAVPWKSKGAIDGGRTLIVAAPGVERPARVRHLREKAGEGFLYSVDSGLPVGPFESAVKTGE